MTEQEIRADQTRKVLEWVDKEFEFIRYTEDVAAIIRWWNRDHPECQIQIGG